MSPGQIAEAQRLAREWDAAHSQCYHRVSSSSLSFVGGIAHGEIEFLYPSLPESSKSGFTSSNTCVSALNPRLASGRIGVYTDKGVVVGRRPEAGRAIQWSANLRNIEN